MNTMTSRERVFAALKGEPVDRVPYSEMFIDPKVIDSIQPGMNYEDFVEYADLDIVTCLTMADEPENINWVNTEKRIWKDKWGALQMLTHDVISVITEPPVIDSIDDVANYVPPDPMKSPVFGYARKLVERFKGKRAIAVVGEAAFAPLQYMRAGLANLMMDYILQPELVKKLVQISVDYHVELYRKLIKDEGVEIVWIGDDYAGKTGTFMSPAHFEEFIVPGLKVIVKEIKNAGAFCLQHTDGDIWKILDLLIDTGFDALGPLEPAYMNLEEVRKYRNGAIGVIGNLDVDLLSRGSVEEVKQTTRELLKSLEGLSGHILSSGNTISSSVKGENYMAMMQVAKE